MTEEDRGEGKRRTKKWVRTVKPEVDYRPARKQERSARSPYLTRLSTSDQSRVLNLKEETREAESEDTLEELSGNEGEELVAEVEQVERAALSVSAGEGSMAESEMVALLKYFRERDAEDRDKRAAEAEEEHKRRREEEDRRIALEEEKEAKRHEREMELATIQRDQRRHELTERTRRELLGEKLKGLGSFKPGGELSMFCDKFERIMREGEVDNREWAERLHARLPDGLSVRVTEARDEGLSYGKMKELLLKSVGETSITYGNQVFELSGDSLKSRNAGEIEELLKKVTGGMFRECKTVGECGLALALTVLRRVLPQSGKTFLELRKMGSWRELRSVLEDWLSGRQQGNFYKPLGASEGPARGGGGRSEGKSGDRPGGSLKCFTCGGVGHKAVDCKRESGSRVGGQARGGVSVVGPRPITCFTCGKGGHKSLECPQKGTTVKKEGDIKMVSEVGGKDKANVAWGKVNGFECRILVDSGAEVGVVPRSMIPESECKFVEMTVAGVHGKASVHDSTLVTFELGGERFRRVAIVRDVVSEEKVSCIVPFNILNGEEVRAFTRALQSTRLSEAKEVAVLTRAQAREEAKLDTNESDVSVGEWSCIAPEGGDLSSQSRPIPEVSSRESQDQGRSDVEASADANDSRAKGEPVKSIEACEQDSSAVGELAGKSVKACEQDSNVVGVPAALDRGGACGDETESRVRELADSIGFVGVGDDGSRFREELKSDMSLKSWRELGDCKERGFQWKNGMLVRSQFVEWDTFRDLVVVPNSFRKRVMEMGHEGCGHLCGDKVSAMVGRYFVWPGMARDIGEHCGSCGICQIRSKHKPRKAPVVERPVLTEPFESMAIDLVGPLPKGKGGCQYLLTCVCLATRWPEAVPLRSITAKSVADGLWSIFSKTGIPERILSDQGSQFCSRLVRELYNLLGIVRVRTSPYHPQTNGAVERMHATFKGILGKCLEEKKDWVGQVNFVLFVLRQMPHADSGMSPFDLVYGFRVRTPLDAMYHGLYEIESRELNVCEWVRIMSERLELMRECAAVKMIKERKGRMSYVNKGSKLREFVKGEKVLHRVPGLNSKLSDSWEGPYVILERKGLVNYKIAREGKEKHYKVVHVNGIKKFRERVSVDRLDVVLEEPVSERNILSGECEGYSERDLTMLLDEYKDVFSDKPGNTRRVVMRIDTGESEPIRQAPYSVPLGTREKVVDELKKLESQGIIERSDSSWASPLVPVKKPDGAIRLCVDYRKLNAVTVKEPYYIPGLEEMIELVGRGKVLSKVDLAKGFYQVEVDEQDRDKTCFTCPFGKYRFVRMPFGLTNAPSVFQRLMEGVLAGLEEFCKVYVDDILVVSKNWEEHKCHLGKLFLRLKEAGLTCKRSKCSFGRKRLEFLGHLVGDGVISVPEARVEAIRNHPLPKTRRQLKGFLGLVGFYRRFIKGYHQWSHLLTPHTSSLLSGRVSWTESMIEAFQSLCRELSVSVLLCVPVINDVFVLETDASSSGVGAALSVKRDGEMLPVAFFSRQLKGAQCRYSAQELEGLALFEAIRHFAYYLYGNHFTVMTDHKALVSLRSGRQENRRVYSWALKLTEFSFDVIYRDGKKNVVADDLSRCHEGEGDRAVETESKVKSSASESTSLKTEGEMWAYEQETRPHEQEGRSLKQSLQGMRLKSRIEQKRLCVS